MSTQDKALSELTADAEKLGLYEASTQQAEPAQAAAPLADDWIEAEYDSLLLLDEEKLSFASFVGIVESVEKALATQPKAEPVQPAEAYGWCYEMWVGGQLVGLSSVMAGRVHLDVPFGKAGEDHSGEVREVTLYTHPAPAQAPLTREQEIAVKEGERIAASDRYFKARAFMLDTAANRRLFEAGFDAAWGLRLDKEQAR